MYSKLYHLFIKPSAQQSLEQRIVIFAALLAILTGILTTIQNFILANPASHYLYSAAATCAGILFYCLSRNSKHIHYLAGAMIGYFTLLFAVVWYPSNGTFGATPYFLPMLYIFAAIVLKGKIRILLEICIILVFAFLFWHEYRNQSFLIGYVDEMSRYFDIGLCILITITITSFLVKLVVKSYREEKEKHAKLLTETLENKKKLEKAVEEIKLLKNFLPICANCKKIRNDEGYWQDVAQYISTHTDTTFSHSICPDCIRDLYPDLAEELK